MNENRKGRTKGTPNKVTQDVRQKFNQLLEDNLERMQEDLDSLTPQKRLEMVLGIAKFCLPTLKSIDQRNSGETETPRIVIHMGNGSNPEDVTEEENETHIMFTAGAKNEN